jgi:hypothetical protein
MHRLTLACVLVFGTGGLAACGHSAPASPTSTGLDATTQTTVGATVGQALSQAAASGATVISGGPIVSAGAPAFTSTFPCPSGGSIVTTMSVPASTSDGQGTLSLKGTSRTEFNDCRSQNVVMRGDPALIQSSDFEFQNPSGGAPVTLTATTQTSGAIIAISNSVETRVQFDCTSVITLQIGVTSPPSPIPRPSPIYTGTMTWESPLGTVVRTSACGQSL